MPGGANLNPCKMPSEKKARSSSLLNSSSQIKNLLVAGQGNLKNAKAWESGGAIAMKYHARLIAITGQGGSLG